VLALTDPSGNNLVPLHDSLGSTLWMVNSSGQMQTTFTYTPFGAPSQSGTQSNYPYLFTGREWSDIGGVSQQYYTWARPYSPGLHRFIAPDPIGFAGSGTNLYAYVGNDPIDLSDPTGLRGLFAFVGELFTGTAFGADIQPTLCAGSGFFACAAAIDIAAVTAYELSGGGGGHASLPSVPPALLEAQLAQQLARHGFTPQYNSYDRPSPGTHFDPNQLRPVSDPRPYPNGRTGQQQQSSKSQADCLQANLETGEGSTVTPSCLVSTGLCIATGNPVACITGYVTCLYGLGVEIGCYRQSTGVQPPPLPPEAPVSPFWQY